MPDEQPTRQRLHERDPSVERGNRTWARGIVVDLDNEPSLDGLEARASNLFADPAWVSPRAVGTNS